jgi:uncharacterized protein
MRNMRFAGLLAAFGVAAAGQALVINEIRIDQPGSDNQEYFELAGTAGQSLNNLTYIVIGDGTGGSGVIESVTSLAGLLIPADGYFLAVEQTWTTSPPSGWPGGTPDITLTGSNPLNFENSDNVTHMLVADFTGTNGQDLDTNDDGVLDITPWSSITDSVAVIIDPVGGDKYYSANVVGPDGTFAPGHVYRFPDTSGRFVIGDFDGSPAFDDTPGSMNPVPEPASLAALALGGIALLRRRSK